jgi:hypothetical protein
MVLSYRNALIQQRKSFLHTVENRLCDPSEICALEFKGEFRRFRVCSVSATIGIDQSILTAAATIYCPLSSGKYRQRQ